MMRKAGQITGRVWALFTMREWLLLIFLLIGGASLFVLTLTKTGQEARQNVQNAFYQHTAQMGFRVETIMIEGREKTSREDLMRLMNLRRNDPIFSLDLQAMAQELTDQLPWVETVRIERKLPQTLIIIINESEPRALWFYQGSFRVVSASGEIIDNNYQQEQYRGLPIVKGENAPAKLADYLAMLESQPAFKDVIAEAEWIGGRRWNISLANGILVRLPEQNPHIALQKLIELQQKENIFAKRISVIDMRLPDRAFVQTYPVRPKRKPTIESETI